MTKNYMFDATLVLVLGTGVGMILSVLGQKAINQHYKATCNTRPNHNLIYTQGFLGDTYYCIHNAELRIK
jgi:hypothetical protein